LVYDRKKLALGPQKINASTPMLPRGGIFAFRTACTWHTEDMHAHVGSYSPLLKIHKTYTNFERTVRQIE